EIWGHHHGTRIAPGVGTKGKKKVETNVEIKDAPESKFSEMQYPEDVTWDMTRILMFVGA
ncbi:hypothetical protein KI387_018264, partial [Taxus chinensis]